MIVFCKNEKNNIQHTETMRALNIAQESRGNIWLFNPFNTNTFILSIPGSRYWTIKGEEEREWEREREREKQTYRQLKKTSI